VAVDQIKITLGLAEWLEPLGVRVTGFSKTPTPRGCRHHLGDHLPDNQPIMDGLVVGKKPLPVTRLRFRVEHKGDQ